MTDKQRYYKVGKYIGGCGSRGEWKPETIKPMTHKQACTFISKMMEPALWFVYEVELNGETPLC